ncbi:MAG TPA: hypothetical protein PLM62_11850, partial [Zoogloea sp.]|nr:hypothetical protein [Zoogloea sp.]
MRGLASLLVAVALALAAPMAASLPEPVKALAPGWRTLGSGEARFLGLRLYEAVLWVGAQGYREDAPVALELTYARGFSRDTLVSTSLDEMRRLGGADDARLGRWKVELERVFPDVAAGETLVGVHLP